jgi:hypothetical protein
MRDPMRRLALAAIIGLGLGFGLGLGLGTGSGISSAFASPSPPPSASEPEPPRQRQVEVLQHRPSGFWTSNRPATGGAYRWRMLGIGVVLAAGAGLLMWRLTRRANAERVARQKSP